MGTYYIDVTKTWFSSLYIAVKVALHTNQRRVAMKFYDKLKAEMETI
jgi:hypothetical protein